MTYDTNDGLRLEIFSITWLTVYVTTFYVNYLLVLPRVFKPLKWSKVFLGFVCLYLFFVFCRYLFEQVLAKWWFDSQNYPEGTGILYYLYDNFFFSMRPIILSTAFWVILFLIRLLEYNNYILEEQKNTEIKFLKAQINPHFIFNTLNNIYSMVYFQSPRSLSAIEKLSNIMRFVTYEAQRNNIQLIEEINYINAYIELEELRHEQKGFILFTIEMQNEKVDIPPYTLSPLVENALKHGATGYENAIKINLQQTPQLLIFTVTNAIGTQKKDKPGGVGMNNLRKRLEILLPGKHQLQYQKTDQFFTARLEIILS
jgi:two-component system LytT family sensor kinase